jgi:hypothetical protein
VSRLVSSPTQAMHVRAETFLALICITVLTNAYDAGSPHTGYGCDQWLAWTRKNTPEILSSVKARSCLVD